MSRLNFASLGDAFILGSQQIKDTQEEIARLKTLVLETSGMAPKKKEELPVPPTLPPQSYSRIGPSDNVEAVFTKTPPVNVNDLIDKLIQSPRFEDIVKSYITKNYPNFNLNAVKYTPSKETFGSMCDNTKNMIIFILVAFMFYIFFNLFLEH